MIIGITGTNGAGKGTIVEFLKKKGFKHYSVRDYLIEEIERRGMNVNRNSMVSVANDLREKNYPSYIVEQIYEKAKKEGENCIIESIRTPGEIDGLKKKGEFVLIAVDANQKKRYERIVGRKSTTDAVSFEEFVADEEREMSSEDLNKQNLGKCIELADYVLENSGTIEKLREKVFEILAKLE